MTEHAAHHGPRVSDHEAVERFEKPAPPKTPTQANPKRNVPVGWVEGVIDVSTARAVQNSVPRTCCNSRRAS